MFLQHNLNFFGEESYYTDVQASLKGSREDTESRDKGCKNPIPWVLVGPGSQQPQRAEMISDQWISMLHVKTRGSYKSHNGFEYMLIFRTVLRQ